MRPLTRCCAEAVVTTVVMFCGYMVCGCVIRAGANYMVCDGDAVAVSCIFCRSIALVVLKNRPTGLFSFLSLSGVLLSSQVYSII